MEKLIIVAFGYDGKNSNNANSICLNKIIKDISKKYDVLILTSTCEKENIILDEMNNIIVHKIPYRLKRNGQIDFINWEGELLREISSYDINGYSKLLTVSFPFPILDIGFKLKKKFLHLEWYVYELDPYAYNNILRYPRFLFFYRWFKERRIFNLCDCIFLTHELFDSYNKSIFKVYSDKFVDIGIPLLEIFDYYAKPIKKDENIKLTYMGSLYSKVRNPKYILELFSEIEGVNINFYGPDPNQISEIERGKFGNRLTIHGKIPKEEVISVLKDSNILLNIGNSVNNQLPSKVLEYIGTGKPIINIYSIEDDTSNIYLKKYPNSLLINQNNDLKTNIKKIENFLSTIDRFNTIIDPKKIETIFENDTVESVSKRVVKSLSITKYGGSRK